MKKIFLFAAIISVLAITACSNGSQNKIEDATSESAANDANMINGYVDVDLSDKGFPIIIKVPQGVKVEQTAYGTVEIKDSAAFQIQIAESTVDIAQWKKDIQANDVNKFKRFIAEEADGLFYESAFSTPEFHFVKIFKGKTNSYEIQDIKGAAFSEADAKAMYQSAKSVTNK